MGVFLLEITVPPILIPRGCQIYRFSPQKIYVIRRNSTKQIPRVYQRIILFPLLGKKWN
jgi:hypothetical protein